MTAFTLAHLSDPHLAPLPQPSLRDLMSQRVLGYLNWRRNRHLRHSRKVADALLADIKTQAPDHIAVTGDLVNIALDAEFRAALDWMRHVGPPQDVSLVPGNHDAYVRSVFPRGITLWSDYMRGDGASDNAPLTFPYLRQRGPLLLIGTSTAIPTAPFMATGTLGQPQLEALDRILTKSTSADSFRVLLIHHPLRSRRRHKRLTDAPALRDILRRHGVELILHGHDHKHSLMWFDGPRGQIPAIGVPSASAVIDGKHDPAAYNLFRIMRESETWRCDWSVRGYQDGRDGISELREKRLIGA